MATAHVYLVVCTIRELILEDIKKNMYRVMQNIC